MPSSKKHAVKAVLDTNVWVSALIWGGKPAEIIKAAENRQITIFISEEILSEINQVLNYPKITKIYQGTGLRRQDLVEAVLKTSKFAKPTQKVTIIKEHPADNKFLECAISIDAAFVVSGDKHLLKVVSYEKTRIVSVSDFLKSIQLPTSKT